MDLPSDRNHNLMGLWQGSLISRFLLAFALIAGQALITSDGVFGEEFSVSNAAEITTILPNLNPGDTVVMANGIWTNQQIDFAARGTKRSTMKSATELSQCKFLQQPVVTLKGAPS